MFKDKLKKLRIEKKLTQEELSKKLFVSRSAIAKWEQGRGLPHEKMIDDIASFFGISKTKLYDENEPNRLINQLAKKNKYYLLFGLLLIMILCISIIGLLISDRSLNNTSAQFDKFYSTNYLDQHYLKNFNSISNNKNKSILYEESFFTNIASQYEFDAYAKYILDYLDNSPYISYFGFSSGKYLDSPVSNISTYDDKVYIKMSDNLQDYKHDIYTTDDTYKYSYHFYYLPSLNYKRTEKDCINPYVITISYSFDFLQTFPIDYNRQNTNYKMSIYKENSVKSNYTYYLYDDFYQLNKIEINKDNFETYFEIRLWKNNENNYWYYIVPKTYAFKYYLPVTIEVTNEQNINETISTIMYGRGVGNIIKLTITNQIANTKTNEDTYIYSLIIGDGYIYQSILK